MPHTGIELHISCGTFLQWGCILHCFVCPKVSHTAAPARFPDVRTEQNVHAGSGSCVRPL